MAGTIQALNATEFAKAVEQEERPVVIDVWAPWCGPCRAMAPHFEQAAGQFADRAVFYKLNADENPEIMRQFKIMGIPTLLYFNHGKLVDRKMGVQTAAAIAKRLSPLLDNGETGGEAENGSGWLRRLFGGD